MYVFSQFVARLRAVLVVFIFVVTSIMNGVEVIFKTKHKKVSCWYWWCCCTFLCCVALTFFWLKKSEQAKKKEERDRTITK